MTDASQPSLFPVQRKRVKPRPAIERRTHIAIADLLRTAVNDGWTWMHIPNGEYREEATAKLLFRMGVLPGVFDFLLISPEGRHYWLELKRGTAPLSAAQLKFRDGLRARNIPHAVARSFEDAVAWLNTWNVLRPIKVQ